MVWDDSARSLGKGALMERHGESGTSILVVGFDEPALEVERDLPDVGKQIADSAARWFWPALLADELQVSVECHENDELVFSRHAGPDLTEVAPFVKAATEAPWEKEHLEAAGDLAEREIALTIPAQRLIAGHNDNPRPRTEAKATLRVRVSESGEDSRSGTIALQRGTGMIVSYQAPRRRLRDRRPLPGRAARWARTR